MFIKFSVGDGKNIHLWLDWWHPDDVLCEQYGYKVVYDAQSKMEAKLSSVIKGKKWEWQPAKSEDLVSIQSKLPMVKIGESGKPIWVILKRKKKLLL
jgi:hypothetical protein